MNSGSENDEGRTLTETDVQKLLVDPSTKCRADTVQKIGRMAGGGALSDKERELAGEIFRIMARDVAQQVREALAKSVKDYPELPSDVARRLANDEADAVALPVVAFSKALSEDDLLKIVDSGVSTRQVAVAGREEVTGRVADALVETGNADAAVTLAGNPGARLPEAVMTKLLDRYGEDERLHTPLVHRKVLPLAIAERLAAMISDELKSHLVSHHALSPEVAADLLLDARERATIGLLSDAPSGEDLEGLVRQMAANGRLTASVILRALCTGDMAFFETALAVKAGISVRNSSILIRDQGRLGLKSLYQKCQMPEELYPAFEAAVGMVRTMEAEKDERTPEVRSQLVMERILTQFEYPLETYQSDDVDYLIGRLVRSIEQGEVRSNGEITH